MIYTQLMAEKKPEEPQKDPAFTIKTADFDNPRPFETRQGVMHGYTYLPFLGWVPQNELLIIVAIAGLTLAIAIPKMMQIYRSAKAAKTPVESVAPTNP